MANIDPSVAPEKPSRGRMILGAIVFVAGQFAPALVPLIAGTNLSVQWKSILSGACLFVVPELMLLAAIAIWGKPGYLYLKAKVFGVLKRRMPPDTVSPTRYRIGLVMFVVPVLLGWMTPYVTAATGVPAGKMPFAIAGDILFVGSFFVLGGDFWDKFRALFVQRAVVNFPRAAAAGEGGGA